MQINVIFGICDQSIGENLQPSTADLDSDPSKKTNKILHPRQGRRQEIQPLHAQHVQDLPGNFRL